MIVFLEIFRWIGVITGYPFKWIFFKTKLYYENDRASRRIKGGSLIISNHFNPWDYVANVFLFFPRKLFVVASEDAFRNPLQSFGMKFFGGIKADRVTRDMSFVKKSAEEIKKGHLVQIFPEGHNTDDGTIKPFYPSYLMIALRSRKPIVPVVSDGRYGFTKRLHQIVGEPIELSDYLETDKPSKADIDRLNDIIYKKVLDLRAQLDARIAESKKKRGRKKK